MPVYRGDDLWRRALRALSGSRSLIGDLVVSFDGPTRDQLAGELLREFGDSLQPIVLTTPYPMSSVEHLVWLLRQSPVREWENSQLVMLIAEDDMATRESLEVGIAALAELPAAILFGSWGVYEPSDMGSDAALPSDSPLVTVYQGPAATRRLLQVARRGEPTSISGLTLSVAGLRSYTAQVRGLKEHELLLHGIRAEYFLATQPTVTALIQVDPPIFQIQMHPDQEGRITPRRLLNHDEALYQLWLLMRGRRMSTHESVLAYVRLIRRALANPSVLLSLPSAMRTFRMVTDAD
jgi:hypothetical protein